MVFVRRVVRAYRAGLRRAGYSDNAIRRFARKPKRSGYEAKEIREAFKTLAAWGV